MHTKLRKFYCSFEEGHVPWNSILWKLNLINNVEDTVVFLVWTVFNWDNSTIVSEAKNTQVTLERSHHGYIIKCIYHSQGLM